MKILMHVNYCEGEGKLDECFAWVKQYGYDGVELRWRYGFKDIPDQKAYRAKVADLKQKYADKEIVFGGPVPFCRGEAEEVKRLTAEYLDFLEWAHTTCGTTLMNGMTGTILGTNPNVWRRPAENGSAIATAEDWRKASEGLRVIGGRAAELGMRIALETHGCYLHDRGQSCKDLMEMTKCDAVGLNHDQGNILLNPNGEPVAKVLELLKGKIYYAHLKNAFIVNGEYVPFPLKYGVINTRWLLQEYKKMGLDMIATETPGAGDRKIAAAEDIAYVRDCLANP